MTDTPAGIDGASAPPTATSATAARDGLLLLDKPTGVSSFQALYPVKRAFRGRKIGHAGTLDPAASGLLVVGVGNGTRLLEFLEGLHKSYRFVVKLGVTTDTYDLEGEVLETRDASRITREDLEALLPRFRGDIMQLPPVYSAIKIQGKRACDRVRAGEEVTLVARPVRVHKLEILSFEPGSAVLQLDCSKGTYVRTIAHDLGELLGCGAAADQIRRLAVGPFRVEDAVAPETAGPENLAPLDHAVDHLPGLRLKSSWVTPMLHGNPVPAAGYEAMPRAASAALPSAPPARSANGDDAEQPEGETCGVFSPDGKLLAIGTLNPLGHLQPRKVLPLPG